MSEWWHDPNHPRHQQRATYKQRLLVSSLQRQLGQTEFDTSQMTKREIAELITQLQDAVTMRKVETGEIDIYGLRG